MQDGRFFYIKANPVRDEAGKIIGVIQTTWDITDRKKIEKALKESEEKFRKLDETIPAAVVMYHGNRFIYVNRATSEITGHSPEELLHELLGYSTSRHEGDC